jgi:hypothetical protein
MATLQSVGIQITETDLTPVTQPVSSSVGAYVGHFNWGPVDEPTNVSSELNLGQIFGTPRKSGDVNAASFLTAESFLKYGNSLKVLRCVSSGALNASSGSTGLLIKNSDAFASLTTGTLTEEFYARYPGLLGESLEVKIFHAGNASANATEIAKYFSYAPKTTEWAESISGTAYVNDEIHIIVYDKQGEITGTKGTVLETWQGLSLNSNARNTNGTTNYFANVLNTGSQYVYVGAASGIFTLTELTGTYTLTGTGTYTFDGAANGTPAAANVVNTLALLESDSSDISLIFAEAFIDDTTVNGALLDIVDARKDVVVFCSAPLDLYTEATDSAKLSAIKTAKNTFATTSNVNLSYSVFDSSPVYVYNRYADNYVWIPACGHMAGLCAYTDEIADPWFSPAGYNRGQLRGVIKLAYNPKTVDRDELYNANINPIISVPGLGIVLYGDKTGQTRATAFDRINVRRLFITLQRVCAEAAKYQLFELNDEFTRNTFVNTIEPYLRDVQSRRGIVDFKVVCDETNNPQQVIDTNRFVADIYVKPARSINFISLNFIASRSGVEFAEIGA